MTFTHDDIQQRLIEFLYDELDAEARAAFHAHLATCTRCRAEVGAWAETRATARTVVRAPLEQPLPSGVHARLMEAATRATAERTAAGAPAVTVPGARAESAPARWWARLRGRWSLPVFATVAAMATLLLGRETIFREARRPLVEAPAPGVALPPPPPLPAPPAPNDEADKFKDAEGASFDHRAKRREPAERRRDAFSGGGKHAPGHSSRRRETAPAEDPAEDIAEDPARDLDRAASRTHTDREASPDDSGIAGMGRSSAGPAVAAKPKARMPAKGDVETLPREALRDKGDAQVVTAPAPSRGGASAKPSPAARPNLAPMAAGSASAPAAAQAPPSALPPASKASTQAAGSLADVPAPAASKSASGPPPDPAIALSARADGLMTARRWPDAVAAYRDLVKRFPKHALVPTWRAMLSAAQSALDNQPDSNRFATPPPPR